MAAGPDCAPLPARPSTRCAAPSASPCRPSSRRCRPPPEPRLWCLKRRMARKPLIINVIQIETAEVGLGERRQSSAGCTIPAGKYSLACGCLYYCSSERLKQHSQKSTLGDRSALCSAMAGVSSLMVTKSSGGYLERRHLESKTRSAAPRANFRLWAQAILTAAQQSPALHRCAILSVGGADRPHLDSGPPLLCSEEVAGILERRSTLWSTRSIGLFRLKGFPGFREVFRVLSRQDPE